MENNRGFLALSYCTEGFFFAVVVGRGISTLVDFKTVVVAGYFTAIGILVTGFKTQVFNEQVGDVVWTQYQYAPYTWHLEFVQFLFKGY